MNNTLSLQITTNFPSIHRHTLILIYVHKYTCLHNGVSHVSIRELFISLRWILSSKFSFIEISQVKRCLFSYKCEEAPLFCGNHSSNQTEKIQHIVLQLRTQWPDRKLGSSTAGRGTIEKFQ